MFKKKPQIKPLAPVRSSDRRRTADAIIAEYGLEVQSPKEANVGEKAAATNEHTTLRNSLLPDNVQSARFTTTHGPDLKQVSGTVFVGSHNGDDARILWFKIDDKMYPSVYTLWRHPGLIPLLHTPGIVINKLQGGADLMTPGLAGGPPFPEKAKKGTTVAIASTEKPSVPVVVGSCLIDINSLGSVQGARGHAVQTVHWFGDEAWSYSQASKSGSPPPEDIPGWFSQDTHVDQISASAANIDLEDQEEGGVSLVNSAEGQTVREREAAKQDERDETTKEEVFEQADVAKMTTKEIDEAFHNAFLYGVHHYMTTNTNTPNFGFEFPLQQSFVMSNLIQPFLPAFTPEQTKDLQVKNTSYKNIKKFIKTLDKQQIVKSKERGGHETIIQDIDFDDRAIAEFKPYRLPKKETIAGTSLGRGEKATGQVDTGDSSVGQQLAVHQFLKPPDRLSSVFPSETNSTLTQSQARDAVTRYIEVQDLISPTNKRLVKLDPLLANSVFDGSQSLDREVQAKGTVPRDALIDRIQASCAHYYTISRRNETNSNSTGQDGAVKPKSGSPPKVKIVLETRGGNKTVTKVSGLEAYFIPPQLLADELRKVCAGSTSVEQLQGSSPKNPVMEVMVQGPQKDAVAKALERRGVKSGWVEVVDKTKKKK